MRLGLLGPLRSSSTAELETATFHLLDKCGAERIIYLGSDGALERMVEATARKLVGADPTDDAAWTRAAALAVTGSAKEVDHFVESEKRRIKLRSLESLPPRILRSMEMVGDRVTILIYDKAILDEEDIFSANLIVFGRADQPLTRRVGTRWFVSPGTLSETGGAAILDDAGAEIAITLYSASGQELRKEELDFGRATKMQIQV